MCVCAKVCIPYCNAVPRFAGACRAVPAPAQFSALAEILDARGRGWESGWGADAAGTKPLQPQLELGGRGRSMTDSSRLGAPPPLEALQAQAWEGTTVCPPQGFP